MDTFPTIDDVPSLPKVEGEYVRFDRDLGYSVLIGWGGIDRWVVMTEPDDSRRGFLERDGNFFSIVVSGNPTGSATAMDTWQEAVSIFF